jgi:hypothetical protein
MKTEEDEAFDELAKRQSAWGGGYQAKRKMAADKFISAEKRKVGERYGYVPKLHPSEWMNDHNEDNLDMVAQPAQEPIAKVRHDLEGRIGWNPKAKHPVRLSRWLDANLEERKALVIQEPLEMVDIAWLADRYAKSAELWSHSLVIGEGSRESRAFKQMMHSRSALLDAISITSPLPAQSRQDVDYWIREATAARQAEMALRRELEAQPAQEPINLLEARKIAAEYGTPDSQIDSGNLYFALSKCLEHIDAQPAQEPVQREWVGLTDDELADLWYKESLDWMEFARAHEAALKEKNNGT